jgi:hypothetical protein
MTWTDKKTKERLDQMKKDVVEFGKAVKGRKEMLAFCNGEKVTLKGAIYAHCYECLGYQDNPGEDRDCENPVCPLYPFAPYSKKKPKSTRTMSAEKRAEVGERFKKYRKTKKK